MRFRDQLVIEAYKEGSATCRNYSRLTHQIRVVAIIAIVAAAVKAGAFAGSFQPGSAPDINKATIGFILYGLAGILALVAWHYQSAFTAMRNRLFEIERGMVLGPWSGHKAVRGRGSDLLSTYLPFSMMVLAGYLILGEGAGRWRWLAVLPAFAILLGLLRNGNATEKKIRERLQRSY